MKIKVGDNVKILTGKDKGKTGKVITTLRNKDRVIVEGINMIKKHVKPGRTNEVGSIQEMEASIHVSNVKLEETTKPKKAVKAKEEKTEKVKKTEKKAK